MVWLGVTWVVLYVLFAGVGAGAAALSRRLFRRTGSPLPVIWLFWLGLALTIAFLQLYSLVLPVNRVARVLVLFIALAGMVPLPRKSLSTTRLKSCSTSRRQSRGPDGKRLG